MQNPTAAHVINHRVCYRAAQLMGGARPHVLWTHARTRTDTVMTESRIRLRLTSLQPPTPALPKRIVRDLDIHSSLMVTEQLC